MAREEIRNFIRINRQHLPIFKIKQLLAQRGYNPEEIEEAANEFLRAQKPSAPSRRYVFVAIIGMVLIAAIIFLIIFMIKPGTPLQLLDLKIIQIDNSISQGDDLNFKIQVLNLGKQQQYDITLRYDILDNNNNYYPRLRSEQTVAIQDKSQFPESIKKINLKPGNYKISVKAFYSSQVATALENFEVLEKVNTTANIQADFETPQAEETSTQPQTQENCDCDDNDVCTKDNCEGGLCKNEIISNCCGNNICESQETSSTCPNDCIVKIAGEDSDLEAQAKNFASSNTNEAIRLCLSISSQYNADFCLNECAEKSKKQGFCQRIIDSDKRDNCYMTLALDNKRGLCSFIANGYKRNTCLALT